MSKDLRIIRASAISPAPAIGVVGLVCAVGLLTFGGNSDLDDAPLRAAGALLLLAPVMYVAAFLVLLITSGVLSKLGMLSRRSLLVFVFAASLFMASLVAYSSPFGLKDMLLSALVFGGMALLLAVPTVLVWWWIASNPSFQRTATRPLN